MKTENRNDDSKRKRKYLKIERAYKWHDPVKMTKF